MVVVTTVRVCGWAGADCSLCGAALSSAEARRDTSAIAQAASGAVGNRLIDALRGLGPMAGPQGGRLPRLVVIRRRQVPPRFRGGNQQRQTQQTGRMELPYNAIMPLHRI